MRCAKCGADVKPTDLCCPNCSQTYTESQPVQDIQPIYDNREHSEEWSGYDTCGGAGSGRRIHVKHINLSRTGFWSALLGIVILITIFMLALPLALLLALVFSLWWLFLRRRY